MNNYLRMKCFEIRSLLSLNFALENVNWKDFLGFEGLGIGKGSLDCVHGGLLSRFVALKKPVQICWQRNFPEIFS